MASKNILDGHPDGTKIGAITEKIGFYGKTCITLRSLPASLTLANTTATSKAAINQIRNLLKNIGLGV